MNNTKKIKLILRDDDLSYFTKSSDLEYLYGDIWVRHPILFSAIPSVFTGQTEVPLTMHHTERYRLLSENKELVSFLKQKIDEGRIEIAQHGYSHETNKEGYELEVGSVEALSQKLASGKKMLEEIFGTAVTVLVPPHDQISKQGVLAAERVGFKTINRGFAPRLREIQFSNMQYLKSFWKLGIFFLRFGTKYRYPQPLCFGKHEEIFSYRIEDISPSNIDEILQRAQGGVLSVTFHYRATSLLHRELLQLLISKVEAITAQSL